MRMMLSASVAKITYSKAKYIGSEGKLLIYKMLQWTSEGDMSFLDEEKYSATSLKRPADL